MGNLDKVRKEESQIVHAHFKKRICKPTKYIYNPSHMIINS